MIVHLEDAYYTMVSAGTIADSVFKTPTKEEQVCDSFITILKNRDPGRDALGRGYIIRHYLTSEWAVSSGAICLHYEIFLRVFFTACAE